MSDIEDLGEDRGEVVVDCELDATPEKVWRALTVPELAARWLDVEHADAQGRDPDGASYTIVEASPCTRVRYAWSDRTASEPDTVVTIDLTPMPDGRTHFRLTHGVGERAPLVASNTNRWTPMARAA